MTDDNLDGYELDFFDHLEGDNTHKQFKILFNQNPVIVDIWLINDSLKNHSILHDLLESSLGLSYLDCEAKSAIEKLGESATHSVLTHMVIHIGEWTDNGKFDDTQSIQLIYSLDDKDVCVAFSIRQFGNNRTVSLSSIHKEESSDTPFLDMPD